MPENAPIALVSNRIPQDVASRSPRRLGWTHAHQLGADIAGEVARLEAQDGGEIQVAGSGELVQTLLRHDLVDAFHLIVFPVIQRGDRYELEERHAQRSSLPPRLRAW